MCTTQPIRSLNEIQRLKDYYLKKEEYRNYLLVSVCLNTALRICDVLKLKWENILNMDTKDVKNHLLITETKTGKVTKIKLNQSIKSAVSLYIEKVGLQYEYIFANRNGKPITRINAYYIIKKSRCRNRFGV